MDAIVLSLYKQLRLATLHEQANKSEAEKLHYHHSLESFLARETCNITIGTLEMVLYIIEEQDNIKNKELNKDEILLCKNLTTAIRSRLAAMTKDSRINFRTALEEGLKRETFQMSVIILQMLLHIIKKQKDGCRWKCQLRSVDYKINQM